MKKRKENENEVKYSNPFSSNKSMKTNSTNHVDDDYDDDDDNNND